MEHLNNLLAQCAQDISDIATSECEATASSNRLLAELSSTRPSSITQDICMKNTENMLNILIAYTNPETSATQNAALTAALRNQQSQGPIQSPTFNEATIAPASVTDLVIDKFIICLCCMWH